MDGPVRKLGIKAEPTIESDVLAAYELVKQVRWRMWRIIIAESAGSILLIAATGLLLGALYHLAAKGHSPVFPLLAVSTLSLTSILAFAARQRPTLEAAARAADQWFDGDALLTSAFDQLQRPSSCRRGGALVVATQANARALQWLPELAEHAPRARMNRVAYALLGTVLAGLLYSLPGAVAVDPPTVENRVHDATNTVSSSDLPSKENMARRSAWGLDRRPSTTPQEPNGGGSGRSSVAAVRPTFAGTRAASRNDPPRPGAAHGSSSMNHGGRAAGTAEPRALAVPSDPSLAALNVQFVDLPDRSEPDRDSVGSEGLELTATNPNNREGRATGPPPSNIAPARAAVVDFRSTAHPLLRRYVVSYQDQIQEPNLSQARD